MPIELEVVVNNDTFEQTEFTCPRCGSHAFGTHADGVRRADGTIDESLWGKVAEGMCHGYIPLKGACGFTWNRKKDDSKYFKPTGRRFPRTLVATKP